MDNSERKEAVIRHHLKHILEQPFRIFVIHFKPCDHVPKKVYNSFSVEKWLKYFIAEREKFQYTKSKK